MTLLAAQGHRMLEAANGSEGLAAVRAERPDLVITDLLMPVMDGYEFVRQLRLSRATSGVRVVFYTAHYGVREARTLAVLSGASGVLTKPAEPAEVLNFVSRVLAGETLLQPQENAHDQQSDSEHLRLVTDRLSETTADLKAANARLRALINIGLEFASERDADRRLHDVCESARDLFGATYVTLGILERNDHTIRRFLTRGTDADNWIQAGDAVPGILRTVVAERQPLRGDNTGGDPAALQLPLRHPEIHAFLAVPIASPALVYGWICLVGNEGRSFTEDDEQLVMALAGQVGRIYELEHEILERERAEEEMRHGSEQAEHEFRALFESNPLAMWIYDLTTLRFLEVNDAAIQRYGFARDEFFAMTIKDIRPPEDIDGLLTQIGEPRDAWQRSGSWRHRVKSGEIIDVDITSHTITFAGKATALVVAQDVTERKRAEEEIRHRAELSALGAAVGLSLIDADSLAVALQRCAEALVTHLDAAFARIWTLNESEGVLELQASAGLYTHLDGPHGKVPLGQFKIGRIARDRTPHLTNSVIGDPEVSDQDWARRERMVAFAGHPLIVRGRVLGVMALFARHTLSEAVVSELASVADHIALGIERHRSAEALQTAEERMRFALESAGVGIWDMDYTTGVLRWSETLEAQYGLQPGTFEGTFEGFALRVHPDDRESTLETVGKAMKSGGEFTTQHRATWRDGTARWLSGAGRIILGENGEPIRGVGISLDVTERRTLEEQYQQSQKMEAVGRLAGGVAHDFNNLLTVILGNCELLLGDLDADDPARVDVAEIQKAGASAAGLTRQLLAFSRKQIIEPTLLDLNVVVTDMRKMLDRLIGEDVKVELGLRPGLVLVKADRGQVEQIVMNLAVNARDAMPRGGTLTIGTANVELDEHYALTHLAAKPGRYLALTVTDTGVGMTPDVQARLFEPFFTTKEVGKGTGLGLATVHGIITQSGGSVAVYSEVGKGTSFKVYFPAAEAGDIIVEPARVARPRAGAETILLVEDAEGLRELARRLLERQGYTVLLAADAQEALQLFEENPAIDVILTDVVMPGASGPELTRELVERKPGLKVIYMSGYTEETIASHGVLNPGIDFLHKPFTAEALERKIREVLDR